MKERAAKANPVVHQVKILKDAAKPGADAAAAAAAKSPKGKGFAFVELTEHEHALCALRQLNNNPVPFGAPLPGPRPRRELAHLMGVFFMCSVSAAVAVQLMLFDAGCYMH